VKFYYAAAICRPSKIQQPFPALGGRHGRVVPVLASPKNKSKGQGFSEWTNWRVRRRQRKGDVSKGELEGPIRIRVAATSPWMTSASGGNMTLHRQPIRVSSWRQQPLPTEVAKGGRDRPWPTMSIPLLPPTA